MMTETEVFRVAGLAGEKKLSGTIAVSGSKNEALPLLASALLFGDPVRFANMPQISDIESMRTLLESIGVVSESKEHTLTVDARGISKEPFNRDVARKFRASVIATGPLLARTGEVVFPPPGGCLIGKRPIDVFLSGYEKMGATVSVLDDGEVFRITAPEGGLRGAHIIFRVQSVTGTEALLMAAVLAHGTTTLENVALEPEVTALAEALCACGAKIDGIGTTTLVITGTGGVPLSFGDRSPIAVIPDRIEAGSFIVLGALCAENLTITNCATKHLSLPLEMLRDAGVSFEATDTTVTISNNTKANKVFRSLQIRTHEYPGFPTDLQAPMSIFATQATGESVVEEMIFEGRLGYLEDIARMGANIVIADSHKAIITGPMKLTGRELYSPDLRAGLAYIIAALVAKGTSHIYNIHYIERGYEHIEEKLRGIGVAIERAVV